MELVKVTVAVQGDVERVKGFRKSRDRTGPYIAVYGEGGIFLSFKPHEADKLPTRC